MGSIDEILFDSILPHHHRDDVERIDFLMVGSKEAIDEKAAAKHKKKAFRRALMYLLATIAFLIIYAEYCQDVLPPDIRQLSDRCMGFILEEQQPLCTGWTWYLRGKAAAGGAVTCFPFPEVDTAVGPVMRSVGA